MSPFHAGKPNYAAHTTTRAHRPQSAAKGQPFSQTWLNFHQSAPSRLCLAGGYLDVTTIQHDILFSQPMSLGRSKTREIAQGQMPHDIDVSLPCRLQHSQDLLRGMNIRRASPSVTGQLNPAGNILIKPPAAHGEPEKPTHIGQIPFARFWSPFARKHPFFDIAKAHLANRHVCTALAKAGETDAQLPEITVCPIGAGLGAEHFIDAFLDRWKHGPGRVGQWRGRTGHKNPFTRKGVRDCRQSGGGIGERLHYGFMCAGRQVGRQETALGRLNFQGKRWSERQDLNLRRLGPKPSALARLSYAPIKLT